MPVENSDSVLGKLLLSLLQLCKQAANHPGGADILGREQRETPGSAPASSRCPRFFCFYFYEHTSMPPPAEAAGSCLGELGPVDFSSIALLRGRDPLYAKAASLFTSSESQSVYIVLNCMNEALTQQRYRLSGLSASFRGGWNRIEYMHVFGLKGNWRIARQPN